MERRLAAILAAEARRVGASLRSTPPGVIDCSSRCSEAHSSASGGLGYSAPRIGAPWSFRSSSVSGYFAGSSGPSQADDTHMTGSRAPRWRS